MLNHRSLSCSARSLARCRARGCASTSRRRWENTFRIFVRREICVPLMASRRLRGPPRLGNLRRFARYRVRREAGDRAAHPIPPTGKNGTSREKKREREREGEREREQERKREKESKRGSKSEKERRETNAFLGRSDPPTGAKERDRECRPIAPERFICPPARSTRSIGRLNRRISAERVHLRARR